MLRNRNSVPPELLVEKIPTDSKSTPSQVAGEDFAVHGCVHARRAPTDATVEREDGVAGLLVEDRFS